MSDPEFILLGDALWLDFINTARGRTLAVADGLPDPPAYHRWIKAEKLITDAADLPWDEVTGFRERLLAIATALDEDRQPPSSAIHELNRVLARRAGYHQLTRAGGSWRTSFVPQQASTALEAIASSAAQTLADPEVRVHRCRAEPCTLFFIDRSPGFSRTWCSAEPGAHPVRVERRRAAR